MAIITYTDLQQAMGLSSSTDVALLTALAAGAQSVGTTWCLGPDGSFETQARTEYYTGLGTPSLVIRYRPITAVVAVYVDPSRVFGSDTLLTYNTDYTVDWKRDNFSQTGILFLLQWPQGWLQSWPLSWGMYPSWGGLTGWGRQVIGWPVAPGVIKVTYTSGWTTIPDDLKQSMVTIGCWMYRTQEWGGMVNSGSYIDVSTSLTLATEALAGGNVPALGSSRATLARYREIPWAN